MVELELPKTHVFFKYDIIVNNRCQRNTCLINKKYPFSEKTPVLENS